MSRFLVIIIFCSMLLSCNLSFGQGRLIFNNDAYLVIDNGAFVVLDNSATNALTQLGTGGRIISENENDKVKWNIGTATGTYTIPYSTSTGVEFPNSVTINVAGVGAGNITFSTYQGAIWDNNTYRPSDVTHMNDLATGAVNNSNHVIDRFWIIDALGYGTKPSSTLSLTYIDAEHLTPGNIIVEANLGAQRFNNSSNIWGDYLPQGTINTATNVVSAIPAVPANFFRSWTLSETTSPLATELLSYNLICDNNKLTVKWDLGSEENISKYRIEGSNDGVNYLTIKEIDGGQLSLSYEVSIDNNFKYYRLLSLNTNGTETIEAIKEVDCIYENNILFYYSDGMLIGNINNNTDNAASLNLVNAMGQVILTKQFQLYSGNNIVRINLNDINTGIYFVNYNSLKNKIEKSTKIFIQK